MEEGAGMDAGQYSPLTLAFLGDAVYELIIREMLVRRGNAPAGKLSEETINYVRAGSQAKLMEKIKPALSDEERAVYRRGRNAKTVSMPKHATVHDYRTATGFEALIGYLYLNGSCGRLIELLENCCGLDCGRCGIGRVPGIDCDNPGMAEIDDAFLRMAENDGNNLKTKEKENNTNNSEAKETGNNRWNFKKREAGYGGCNLRSPENKSKSDDFKGTGNGYEPEKGKRPGTGQEPETGDRLGRRLKGPGRRPGWLIGRRAQRRDGDDKGRETR